MRTIILQIVLFFALSSIQLKAQIGFEFWFAAPEISSIHGDEPIHLIVTTLDEEAIVELFLPAQFKQPSIKESIPANTQQVIDITFLKDQIENDPENMVLNNGLFIKSNAYIAAQYYVRGGGNNIDIFRLKGSAALGKEFVSPFQNFYPNRELNYNQNSLLKAYSSIDIVATSDDTEITIIPSNDAIGHLKNIPFTIQLNKGQTYSIKAAGLTGEDHLGGTIITSTKEIAVTVKDDSVFKGENWDLIGDQITAIHSLDTAYVVFEGDVVLTAAFDNTTINFDEQQLTLNKGESITEKQLKTSLYVTGNKPFSVFQIVEIADGEKAELAGGVLAPIGCNGSNNIQFSRTEDTEFTLYITTDSIGRDSFKLNNIDWIIKPYFTRVANNKSLYTAKIEDSDYKLIKGQTYSLSNSSSDFSLSYKFGDISTGCGFAFLSDFGTLNLGEDYSICNDQEVYLSAGVGKETYLWNTGETASSIQVSKSGLYSVTASYKTCQYKDSIEINFTPSVSFELPVDTTFCSGDTVKIELDPSWSVYWQNELQPSPYLIYNAGFYTVKASNEFGCEDQDTMRAIVIPSAQIDLGNDTIICTEQGIVLGKSIEGVEYLWNTGSNKPTILVKTEGEYILETKNSCGNFIDSVKVEIWNITAPNIITPNNDGVNDELHVLGLKNGKWEIEIYNRYGKLIYINENYRSGDFNATGINSGVYYYSLKENNADCTAIKSWLQVVK